MPNATVRPTTQAALESVLARLSDTEGDQVRRLVEWLRIKSISTKPEHKGDCASAAKWAADHLAESGFTVKVEPTGSPAGSGHPIVMATSPGGAGYSGPHVLFYGHYDVQPVDPRNLWESDPFEPVVRDARPGEAGGKRIVARGAVDDKGQVAMFLEAMRAWKEATGETAGGVRFTVMLEGEEESGSVNLDGFVRERNGALKGCDVCLISDTGMLDRGKPAITYGVRGLAYTEVVLHAANQDLHSGLWGGRCPNPISELTKVLAQLWDKKRRVTLPGFYDDVVPLKKVERENWRKLKFSAAAALKKIGLSAAADVGEEGYTAMEREWGRPTAEINGIIGGYTEKGAKTVIPAHASAKVSFRLVADQDPEKVTKAFFKWCKDRTPPGCRWEFISHSGGHGVTCPVDSTHLQAAARAIRRATGKAPALIKSGGSIPVAGLLKSELGIDTIFMGFGLDDDRVHSPNEKFELECYRMGTRCHAVLVDELRGR
jgi:acetylornithine deacetylase/succinyl-diaminopimelate desuccinylase-like protein